MNLHFKTNKMYYAVMKKNFKTNVSDCKSFVGVHVGGINKEAGSQIRSRPIARDDHKLARTTKKC